MIAVKRAPPLIVVVVAGAALAAAIVAGAGGCSLLFAATPCSVDEPCADGRRCVNDFCEPLRDRDAPAGEGEGEGDAAGEGEGEGEGEVAGEGEGEGEVAGEGEGEGEVASEGEGEGDGPADCTGLTACAAALCAAGAGAGDGVYSVTLDGAGAPRSAFCFAHDGDVWTLIAKAAGAGALDFDAWDALVNADDAAMLDFDAGEDAILHGYDELVAQELLVGFLDDNAAAGTVPSTFVRIPLASPSTPSALLQSDSAIPFATEPWLAALGPAAVGEVLPVMTNGAPCVVFGGDYGLGKPDLRLGVVDDCDDPRALIGIGSSLDARAGAVDEEPDPDNTMFRTGFLLAR